jgi:F0F1-type ATP synthase epsilon subunit
MAKRTDASTGELIDVPQNEQPKPDAHARPAMHIKVYSPFKTYFDEDGYSISAINATGPFDILPHHHNFLTLLDAGEMVIDPVRGSEQKIRISGGLMHVKADKVTVFLDV